MLVSHLSMENPFLGKGRKKSLENVYMKICIVSASMIVLLKGVAVPMCRAYLACLVPSCEIGKIYAMTTSMESLAPVGAAPIYTLIYNYTIDKYPSAFNFFSASVYLYCVILIS